MTETENRLPREAAAFAGEINDLAISAMQGR